jgi:hypothetical protein
VIWAAYQRNPAAASLTIEYPYASAVFPPEIAPPTFRWTEKQPAADKWLVTIQFAESTNRLHFLTATRF